MTNEEIDDMLNDGVGGVYEEQDGKWYYEPFPGMSGTCGPYETQEEATEAFTLDAEQTPPSDEATESSNRLKAGGFERGHGE